MDRNTRKIIGILALLLGLFLYVIAVVTVATTLLPPHWAVELGFYALAGIAWAIPLKPFMAWMSRDDPD